MSLQESSLGVIGRVALSVFSHLHNRLAQFEKGFNIVPILPVKAQVIWSILANLPQRDHVNVFSNAEEVIENVVPMNTTKKEQFLWKKRAE